MNTPHYALGLDIGSTTIKAVVIDEKNDILFTRYARHYSEVRKSLASLIGEVESTMKGADFSVCMTGSGAIALSSEMSLPFIQEVVASSLSIRRHIPDANVVIELGGEDAKLTYLTDGLDQRMNETCAGGTGAFIDQMASFILTDAAGLDKLALRHRTIYPIASRCGVFAKTDILPLLNEGCSREDIAASIMQAVVNQTISGLARGRPIKGKVVFLGGPLTFLQSLRKRFVSTLKLEPTEAVFPEHGQFFVAIGAALSAMKDKCHTRALNELVRELGTNVSHSATTPLPPLFSCEEDRIRFHKRHQMNKHPHLDMANFSGNAWLGFDCGSTTIKSALIDSEGKLLFSSYAPNRGDPLSTAMEILKDIYKQKSPELNIVATAVTGYGSQLLAAGLNADIDEVETVSHFAAARFFDPDVSCILDIGGQDIKCMRVSDGAITSIQLNEACSAGCGSFIENFAETLQMSLPQFVEAAMSSDSPVDLGTRCTVFMNSRVRQAQKEQAAVGDIAAGLAYSVIRNACFKVMKITNVEELGKHVVVQGGAFANDALLRTLEMELGCHVTRPEIAGLMGAFGAALIARERGAKGGASCLISPGDADLFSVRKMTSRCQQCTNNCLLTINTFPDSSRFVSGNRCDRGSGKTSQPAPNLYNFKYRRLFADYVPLPEEKAWRGNIGIPRALNIFENYPLWFTLFTRLGYHVALSAPSSKELYFQGHETIPSQTVCFPAKLAHGHVLDLVKRNIRTIFFPCVPREQKDATSLSGNYNCPVVTGYPELLSKNISALQENEILFIDTFLPLDRKQLAKKLREIPAFSAIPLFELNEAVTAGFREMDNFHRDMQKAGEDLIRSLESTGQSGIVLAGHPYHVDPGIHNGIADLIASYGIAVITEDAVSHLKNDPGTLRVVDQWAYHSRLYRAGAFAAEKRNLAVLQLVSFGCGIDAITTDQLEEIVRQKGGIYAQIKIDEGVNLGPARIRIRSLLAMLTERSRQTATMALAPIPEYPVFRESMRDTHTILIPQMSPVHFQFLETVFSTEGYQVIQLPGVDREAIDLGLRYVNNDACYPAIIVVGQLLQAIRNHQLGQNNLAVLISRTGGGCRATNYIAFLRKALQDASLGHIPILSFDMGNLFKNEGMKLTGHLLKKIIMAVQFGDALMRMQCRISPYETMKGSAAKLAEKWAQKGKELIASGNIIRFDWNMLRMIRDFDSLPLLTEDRKPRVGLVGEILLKYHPDANNHALKVIEEEGGEAVVTDLMDFALYSLDNAVFNYRHLAGSWRNYITSLSCIFSLEITRWAMRFGFRRSRRFDAPLRFNELRKKTDNLISMGHQAGEGWLLAAEMVKMLENDIDNILCMQPFGCLPNHITGKGLFRELKQRYPKANVIALDYDAGASEVNQINRIKLMMSAAAC